MPVILDRSDYEQWLDPAQEMDALLSLLKPYPEKEMEAYPVGLAVNKPVNNGSELIKRAF